MGREAIAVLLPGGYDPGSLEIWGTQQVADKRDWHLIRSEVVMSQQTGVRSQESEASRRLRGLLATPLTLKLAPET